MKKVSLFRVLSGPMTWVGRTMVTGSPSRRWRSSSTSSPAILCARVVAPVESARRVLRVGDGQGVIVDAAGGDEDDVRAPGEGIEERRHVLAQRRRVGDVEHAVEALAAEALAQARVVLAVAGDDRGRRPGAARRAGRD